MLTTKSTIFVALVFGTLGFTALAQAGPKDGMMRVEPMGGVFEGFDFAAVDADKNGKITEAEMQTWRAAEVATVNADEDGKLSAEELKAMLIKRMERRASELASRMVERMDADGDGLLSAAELALRPAPAMNFDRLDIDGDGVVTEAEIAAARAAKLKNMGGDRGPGRGDRHVRRGHGMGGWFGGNK